MFRLTIPLVAGIFVSDHFFQGALPVLVSGTGILGCLIGLIVLMKWQGYLSRWLFGGMVFMFLFCVGALLLQQKWQTTKKGISEVYSWFTVLILFIQNKDNHILYKNSEKVHFISAK
jgi:hypothetical protein